jgi:hypothetical protein
VQHRKPVKLDFSKVSSEVWTRVTNLKAPPLRAAN